jgi:hypothetical protein
MEKDLLSEKKGKVKGTTRNIILVIFHFRLNKKIEMKSN